MKRKRHVVKAPPPFKMPNKHLFPMVIHLEMGTTWEDAVSRSKLWWVFRIKAFIEGTTEEGYRLVVYLPDDPHAPI